MIEGVKVFHAGRRSAMGSFILLAGGCLGVTARGADLETAVERAYEACAKIRFEGRTIGRILRGGR